MTIKWTNLSFNPNEKPEGMDEKEWLIIDQMGNLQNKITAIRAWHTRQERKAEVEAKRPAEPPAKAKPVKTGYIAKELVVLNLPHRKPSGDIWIRKNGNKTLLLQGSTYINAKGKPVKTSIPYGATARLVMFYIMSSAIASNSPKVYLGNSFDAFLKAIGASPERRGVKTGARAVLNQVYNIIYASFSIQETREEGETLIDRGKPNKNLVEEYEIWFSKKNKDKAQQGLWGSYIELSAEIWDSLKRNPIPIDWSIVMKIRKNSTALDFYALLTFESAKAQHRGKGRFIPWKSLQEQMGSETENAKKFGAKARAAIREVQKHYPNLKVSFPKGGLLIEGNSLPSVTPLPRLK